MKSVFVGNLPYAATEAELRELFERHGKVYDAKIKKDRETGRPLGYGFVLLDDEEAPRVMEALDGFCFGGRSLRVNESKERGRPPRVQGDRKADREFRRPFSREDAAGEKDRPVRRFQEDSGERRPFRPKRPFSGNFSRDGRFRREDRNDGTERMRSFSRRESENESDGTLTGKRRSYDGKRFQRGGHREFHRDDRFRDRRSRNFRDRDSF